MLKIAHICVNYTSGMANAARGEVLAERKLGVDAKLVFPVGRIAPESFVEKDAVSDIMWARKADVIVGHSHINAGESSWDKPLIIVAHGNPYYMFTLERTGDTKHYACFELWARLKKCHKVVTYWPLDAPYWEAIMQPGKVTVIPPSVDLEYWAPGDAPDTTFGRYGGDINIVSTSRWRPTLDPFPVWNAFPVFADMFRDKTVRLHIYGTGPDFTATPPLTASLAAKMRLGQILPDVEPEYLRDIYRVADMCITAHRRESLTVREAMACGCPVVGDITLKSTPYHASVHDTHAYAEQMARAYRDRLELGAAKMASDTRARAEELFQPERTAKAFISLCEEAIASHSSNTMTFRGAKPGEDPLGIQDKVREGQSNAHHRHSHG